MEAPPRLVLEGVAEVGVGDGHQRVGTLAHAAPAQLGHAVLGEYRPNVRRLIEQMSGEITVKSRLGKGSTFTIWLPLEPAASRPLEEALNAPTQ